MTCSDCNYPYVPSSGKCPNCGNQNVADAAWVILFVILAILILILPLVLLIAGVFVENRKTKLYFGIALISYFSYLVVDTINRWFLSDTFKKMLADYHVLPYLISFIGLIVGIIWIFNYSRERNGMVSNSSSGESVTVHSAKNVSRLAEIQQPSVSSPYWKYLSLGLLVVLIGLLSIFFLKDKSSSSANINTLSATTPVHSEELNPVSNNNNGQKIDGAAVKLKYETFFNDWLEALPKKRKQAYESVSANAQITWDEFDSPEWYGGLHKLIVVSKNIDYLQDDRVIVTAELELYSSTGNDRYCKQKFILSNNQIAGIQTLTSNPYLDASIETAFDPSIFQLSIQQMGYVSSEVFGVYNRGREFYKIIRAGDVLRVYYKNSEKNWLPVAIKKPEGGFITVFHNPSDYEDLYSGTTLSLGSDQNYYLFYFNGGSGISDEEAEMRYDKVIY